MKKVIFCYLVLEICGFFCDFIFKNTINIQLHVWLSYCIEFSVALLFCHFILKSKTIDSFKIPKLNALTTVIVLSFCITLLAVSIVKLSMIESVKTIQHLSKLQYFILAVIIAPVVEELFFRYFLLGKLLKIESIYQKRNNFNVVFIAFLFGLAHWTSGLTAIIYTFTCGVCYGFIYLYSQNIFLCIVAHSINNLISFVGNLLPPKADNLNYESSNYLLLPILIFAGMSFIIYTMIPRLKVYQS